MNLLGILVNANDQITTRPHIQSLGTEITGAFEDTAGEAFKMGVEVGMAAPCFNDVSRGLTVLLSNDGLKRFEPQRNGLGLNNVLYISMLLRVFERRMAEEKRQGNYCWLRSQRLISILSCSGCCTIRSPESNSKLSRQRIALILPPRCLSIQSLFSPTMEASSQRHLYLLTIHV